MNDVLQDDLAARRAIPDLSYDLPTSQLQDLGVKVQAQYPELAEWPPFLAAEAHLYYAGGFRGESCNMQPRSVEFLTFLRTAIALHR